MTPAERIGTMVAELLGDLEQEYGEGFDVLDAVIAVEVVPADEHDIGSIIEHRGTTRRTTVALGLAELLCDSLRAGFERGDDDAPSD